MQFSVQVFPKNNFFHETEEIIVEHNLTRYASEAAETMGFETNEELQLAVRRAMESCEATGRPVSRNFRRIFKSSPYGIIFDWKLSIFAFRLVKLNGSASNPKVAELQAQMLKKFYQE
jgi:hypothetical protein